MPTTHKVRQQVEAVMTVPQTPRTLTLFACGLIVSAIGCTTQEGSVGVEAGSAAGARAVLRLATTTSTRDSGLLDQLTPIFETMNNCRVDVVAVGSGAALRLATTGDADVVIVHAPEAEEAFMAAGHGVRREQLMYNYFVLLGPVDDPAQIRDLVASKSLQAIAKSNQVFVSRGDDSGTHKRELVLWNQGGGRPTWSGYIESGQGMGPTLIMADEMQAYVLADMGTYLRFREKIDLVALAAPSEDLHNPYSVMVVAPAIDTTVNAILADRFVDFLISPNAQQLIADFRLNGQQLFHPTHLKVLR